MCVAVYAALEAQLEELGLRWAGVCRWVEEHWLQLQQVLTKWTHLNEENRLFSEWLAEKEEMLARMRLVDISDPNEVIDQVRKLKVRQLFQC